MNEEEEKRRIEQEILRATILELQQERQLAIERGLIALGKIISSDYDESCERCQILASHVQGCDCFHCRTLSHSCGRTSPATTWENNLTDDIGYGRGVRRDPWSRTGFSGGWQKK